MNAKILIADDESDIVSIRFFLPGLQRGAFLA